ncbi:FAD dependent oxidoreductase [Amniculicola lignicola CBS 123094]|uniref:FAD dependent oxidoreductase n=1 Tax=Amniculicola lignicola CBS 123094 TaxID=1392246 RepID=A0A6A5W0F0_9PLEO|nr:FAD dependent oxidoreductase [Amniculicola lignicola CBS 123094]
MEKRAQIPVNLPVADPLHSYWHIPKSPLANLIEPEPDQEDQKYDYAIIGSGISGTVIAYNLLKSHPSARIVMLEAREACGGATGRNGGHTKAASYRSYLQHKADLGKEEALKIARLEYNNIVETHQLAKDLGVDCENQKCDTVDAIYDQETFENGKKAIEALRIDATEKEREEGGMAWYKIYAAEEAMARFHLDDKNRNPEVDEDEPLAGAFEYMAGRVNAYRLATGILKICVQKGLRLCTTTPVNEVRSSTKTGAGAPKYDVQTPHSIISTDSVIFATNGYTPYLLSPFQGLIVPLRGQITAQRPGKATTLPSPLRTTYSFIYKSGYEYMIPRPLPEGGQHIVIGGGLLRQPEGAASEYGTVDDSTLVDSISKYLCGSLVGYFGRENWGETDDEGGDRIVQEWTGIMGETADGRPFVGEVPGKPGQFMSAGFNGHGMVLCLKSAEALVEIIGGVKPEDIDWFPQSFLVTEDRIKNSSFHGRASAHAPETGRRSVEIEAS